MCGFVAVLALDGGAADRSVVERMSEVIAHRGPDDSGCYFADSVGFGFRRLSILDLSPSGHQPMTTQDGQVTIVFNGEIYNYAELRSELEGLGHIFKSTGDTEVLLRAYWTWGERCLDKLNGMWAFVVYDRRRGRLFGSRDRFGIKPLFYYRHPDHMLFASEIKAIRASGLYTGGPNWRTVSGFMLEGRLDEGSETFYEGIEQIPAATAFEVDREGRLRRWRYWSVESLPPVDVADPAAEFAELFEDAMRLHMRSDVPVGVHLSGGLDSTSIICASARIRAGMGANEPLMAFCYMAREYDESRYIADTIAQTGAQLIPLEISPQQLWESLGRMLWYQDEPVHSMTPLVGFALMALTAANGIKVILNGQGADETIAGYGNYFQGYWQSLLNNGQATKAWEEIGRYAAARGGNRAWLFLRQLIRFAQTRLHRSSAWRDLSHWRHARRLKINRWFTPQLTECFSSRPVDALGSGLNSALIRSIARDPLPIYLRVEDRNSMAHSIEARVPFLDYRLVSFVLGLAATWKIRGPWNKFVLREGMRGRIPESVRLRADKMGFPVPWAQWFAGVLYEPLLDLLHSRSARERGIYDIPSIVQDLARHRSGGGDVAAQLFRVAQFEVWSELERPGAGTRSVAARLGEKSAVVTG
jgi:asparagine synthase (glutamine-hydrolysing)